MKNKIYDALSNIRAEERLKQNTYAFLNKKVYNSKKSGTRRLAVAIACFVAVLFAGLFSYGLYFDETAYVDIDTNPGIEITLNRFGRVIGVYAYNDDGQQVLESIDVKYMSYENAIKALIEKMDEFGYIEEAEVFAATLQCKDSAGEKQQLDSLKASIESVFQSRNKTVELDVFSVDADTKANSHDLNLTPAKYLAILELQKLDPTATFDNCRDHTIHEIRQQIHDHMGDGRHSEENENDGHNGGSHDDEPDNGHNSGSGSGDDHNSGGHHSDDNGSGNGHGHN